MVLMSDRKAINKTAPKKPIREVDQLDDKGIEGMIQYIEGLIWSFCNIQVGGSDLTPLPTIVEHMEVGIFMKSAFSLGRRQRTTRAVF